VLVGHLLLQVEDDGSKTWSKGQREEQVFEISSLA